jgi:Fur family ferric uptake transcriptional regulator
MNDHEEMFSKKLQEHGYRLTGARKAILKALASSGEHVSADELVELVHQDAPGVGRMTVYRTLDLLTKLTLIRPVFHGTAAARFVVLDQGHHHHLVCFSCKRVIEFDQCVLREIEKNVSIHHDFQIQGHLLEIYGRCRECRQQQPTVGGHLM